MPKLLFSLPSVKDYRQILRGACRQQWHRRQKRTPGTRANVATEIKAEIESVYKAVNALTEKFSFKDLVLAATSPLEDAIEALDGIVNTICENSDEKPANGWEASSIAAVVRSAFVNCCVGDTRVGALRSSRMTNCADNAKKVLR